MKNQFQFKAASRACEVDIPLTEKEAPVLSSAGAATHLSISVRQEDGGWNHFYGQQNQKGIYLSIKPVIINGSSRQIVLLGKEQASGYKILLEENKRYSAKKLQAKSDEMQPLVEQLKEFYLRSEHGKVVKLATKQSELAA